MESTNNYYIVQELCDSDLEKYLKSREKLTESEAKDILRQICNGFIALVREGIVHRYVSTETAISSLLTYS